MALILLHIAVYPVAALVILALGRRKDRLGPMIALGASALSMAALAIFFFTHPLPQEYVLARRQMTWFTLEVGFLADQLALLMGGIVSSITLLVLGYSRDYMRRDPERGRFFALMCLFAGSMLGIVYALSSAQLFLFWELVGISSYLLIGFWHRQAGVASAARRVLITIVVGDVLLFLGLLALGTAFGTFTFSQMLRQHLHIAFPVGGVLLVMLGALAKSAQLPFSAWLPWAMEGPTPVSALLHAATMVKAGIFLLARIFPLLEAAHLLPLLTLIALATILASALAALLESDIKRILAYSTVSQLGFMALALGLSSYGAALFHLFNDAFYKALLFLGAGVIIHSGGSRNIFGLRPLSWQKDKVYLILTVVGVLGISGAPPFNGFFSKDLIIESSKEAALGGALFPLVLAAVFLSMLYIFRWLLLILRRVEKAPDPALAQAGTRFGPNTIFAMGALALGVGGSGWLGTALFQWLGLAAPHYRFAAGIGSAAALLGTAFLTIYLSYLANWQLAARFAATFPLLARIIRADSGLPWIYAALARALRAIGEALSAVDRHLVDGVLEIAAGTARRLGRFNATLDRKVLDDILESAARETVKFCRGAHRFDLGAIDGLIGWLHSVLVFWAARLRRLVTGFAPTYTAALFIAAIAMSFLIRLALVP